MSFRLGGGTRKGISKPGEIVWSRVVVPEIALQVDIGRAGIMALAGDDAAAADHAHGDLWHQP